MIANYSYDSPYVSLPNVLMISLGDEMLRQPNGSTVHRHLDYANRFNGRINVILRSPASHNQAWDGKLFGYPTGRTDYVGYIAQSLLIARRLCAYAKPNLITTQDPFGTALVGVIIKKLTGSPLLIQNHSSYIDNIDWLSERRILFRCFNRMAKLLLPHADAYRVVNDLEQQIYINKLHLPAERVKVIPVPVEIHKFISPRDPEELRQLRLKLAIPEGAPVLLWVGRPVKFKRLPFLLETFKCILPDYPNARLLIVGNPAEAQEDFSKIQRCLGLNEEVIWAGYVSYNDLPNYYALADIYLHASIYEGFGRVLVEAGASSIPTVATRSAGAETVLRHNLSGLLVEPNDKPGFVQSISTLLANPSRRRTMGERARSHIIEAFANERLATAIVDQWLDIIRLNPA